MSTIVIMPGGFHPFHAGHASLYNAAKNAFPGAEVYVAATNDTSTRPFPFAIKEKLAKVAGVENGHFIQVKSPFRSDEITSHFNPQQDVLIFVRSEKDKNESPKPGGMKKDGTPAYFQPLEGNQDSLQPFSKHAYFAYLPTIKFGPGITSATEIRKVWPTLDERRKTAMVMSLYPATQKNPRLAANVVKLLDVGMPGDVEEGMLGFLTKPQPVAPRKPLDYDAIRRAAQAAGPQKQVYRSPEEFARSKEKQVAEANVNEITKKAAVDQYKAVRDYKPTDSKVKPKPEEQKDFLKISIERPKKQGMSEEVNPEVTRDSDEYFEPSQNVRMGDFVFNARTFTGGLGQPNAKGLQIRAYDPKNLKRSIGSADFIVKTDKKGNTWLESDDTEVDEPYRSKGVAAMMYAFAKSLGNDIKPSPYQSNAGEQMWNKWGSDANNLSEDYIDEK
jgi:hypothetical protein